MKSINYDKEKLYLVLGNYYYNGGLFVGLRTDEGEDYCDLSINIPNYFFETEKEIIINGDTSRKLVEKLENLGILTDTYKMAFSGFGRYNVMEFNEEIAKDYIIEDFREMNNSEN